MKNMSLFFCYFFDFRQKCVKSQKIRCKNDKMAHLKSMKSKSVLKTLTLATFAIGIATPAFAQHCDVQDGDTMWHIAKRYHLDFKDLCKMNMPHFKDLDVIFKGDEVHLPDQGSGGHSTNENSMDDNIANGNNKSENVESSQALEILRLVNAERKKQGLQELVLSHTLNGIATKKAEDMRDKRYFSHDSPTYGSPFEMLQHFGVHYSFAGENIASGQRSAQQVMNDWMNSSGHRANILNKNFTQLGVGYAEGGQHGTDWVQLFIKE